MSQPKKRFIAGARCPECSREDTIYTLKFEETMTRHCVECDFSEDLNDPAPTPQVGEWTPVKLQP